MKRFILQPLFKGSLVALPLLITVWVIWSGIVWLNGLGVQTLEFLNLNFLKFPGSGLIIMLAVLLVLGLLFEFNPVTWVYQKLEETLLRFPLVKTLYGALKDFANMFDNQKTKAQQVALVDLQQQGMGFAVGIITNNHLPDAITQQTNGDKLITVYLPMSYMVGGYTVFLPEDKVTPLDWSFEDAMRFALTAGVSQSPPTKPQA